MCLFVCLFCGYRLCVFVNIILGVHAYSANYFGAYTRTIMCFSCVFFFINVLPSCTCSRTPSLLPSILLHMFIRTEKTYTLIQLRLRVMWVCLFVVCVSVCVCLFVLLLIMISTFRKHRLTAKQVRKMVRILAKLTYETENQQMRIL